MNSNQNTMQTPSEQNVWKLSTLDKNVINMTNGGSWLFHYKIDIDKLRESIATVLSYYPVFCGHFDGQDKIIVDNGGTPFVFAQYPNLTVDKIKDLWKLPPRLKAPFNLKDFKSGQCTPLSIKAIELNDGFLLSIAVNHACADASTLFQFMEDWAKAYRGEDIEPVIWNQSVIPTPHRNRKELMELLPQQGWHQVGLKALFSYFREKARGINTKAPRPIFVTTAEMDVLRKQWSEDINEEVNTHSLFCAMLAKKIYESRGDHENPRFSVTTVIDLRSRASIPERFAGNAVINMPMASFNIDDNIGQICKQLQDNLHKLLENPKALDDYFTLSLEAFNAKVPYVSFDLANTYNATPSNILVNDFRRFPIYKLNFGGGTPAKVYPNDLPDTIKIWPAAPDKKGVWGLLKGNVREM